MDNKYFLDIDKHMNEQQLENMIDNHLHNKLVLLVVYMLEEN
jgi:hypothetical protein